MSILSKEDINKKDLIVSDLTKDKLTDPRLQRGQEINIAYHTPYGELKFWINDSFIYANYMMANYVFGMDIRSFKGLDLNTGDNSFGLVAYITPIGPNNKRFAFDANQGLQDLQGLLWASDNDTLRTSGMVQVASSFMNADNESEFNNKDKFIELIKASSIVGLNSNEEEKAMNSLVITELVPKINSPKFGKVVSKPVSDILVSLGRLQEDLTKYGIFDLFLDSDKVFKDAK